MIAILLRHAPVRPAPAFDSLSDRGESMARALPDVVASWRWQPTSCFYDASVERCLATISHLDSTPIPYGPGHRLRTMNDVLHSIDTVALICYRFTSIESGDLYHVEDLDLHTEFGASDYDERVRIARRRSGEAAVVIEATSSGWRQIGTKPVPHPGA